jgi:hypothetical protein
MLSHVECRSLQWRDFWAVLRMRCAHKLMQWGTRNLRALSISLRGSLMLGMNLSTGIHQDGDRKLRKRKELLRSARSELLYSLAPRQQRARSLADGSPHSERAVACPRPAGALFPPLPQRFPDRQRGSGCYQKCPSLLIILGGGGPIALLMARS